VPDLDNEEGPSDGELFFRIRQYVLYVNTSSLFIHMACSVYLHLICIILCLSLWTNRKYAQKLSSTVERLLVTNALMRQDLLYVKEALAAKPMKNIYRVA
jgi:hypothetical protein